MYICILDDYGVSFKASKMKELTSKIHEYINNRYETSYEVIKLSSRVKYINCNILTSPGEYVIHCINYDKIIYCHITKH